MNAGCAGQTVRSFENASHHVNALEVYSQQGAIQIFVYFLISVAKLFAYVF